MDPDPDGEKTPLPAWLQADRKPSKLAVYGMNINV